MRILLLDLRVGRLLASEEVAGGVVDLLDLGLLAGSHLLGTVERPGSEGGEGENDERGGLDLHDSVLKRVGVSL